jgi:hypothetical protein
MSQVFRLIEDSNALTTLCPNPFQDRLWQPQVRLHNYVKTITETVGFDIFRVVTKNNPVFWDIHSYKNHTALAFLRRQHSSLLQTLAT